MGRHDEAAMAGGQALAAFQEYVRREGQLADLLQQRLEQDRAMLRTMGAARSCPPDRS